MSLDDIKSMAESLLIITAANAVIVFGITSIYIIIREIIISRKKKDEAREERAKWKQHH
jgi:hypothetical protein